MAPLVTLQRDLARECVAAQVALELRRPGPGTQGLEDGRPFALVGVVGPHVPFLVLVGGEADRGEAAVHGTQERPGVAAVVCVAVLLPIVAVVKELAEHALALEEVRAVVVLYRVAEPGFGDGSEVLLQGGSVLQQGFVELGDANAVAVIECAFLVGIDVVPEQQEVLVEWEP